MATEHLLVWLRDFKLYLINYFEETHVAVGDYSEQHRFWKHSEESQKSLYLLLMS